MGVNRPGAPPPFPFPYATPEGTGVSTVGEGKKYSSHDQLHYAENTALAGL